MTAWAIRQTKWTSLRARIARLTGRIDADDLLQTALMHVLEREPAEIGNADAYILRAARNLAVDRFRHEKMTGTVSLTEDCAETVACTAPLPDAVVLGREQLQRVAVVFEQLDGRTARIFMMHRFDGLGYRVIAEELSVSVSLVEKSISRALCLLTSALLGLDAA